MGLAIEIPPQIDNCTCTGVVAVGFDAAVVQDRPELIDGFCIPFWFLRLFARMEIVRYVCPCIRNGFCFRINLCKEIVHINIICLEFFTGIHRTANAIPRTVGRLRHDIEPDCRTCCKILFPIRNRIAVRPEILLFGGCINCIKFLFQLRNGIDAKQMHGMTKFMYQYGFVFITSIMVRRIFLQEAENVCIIDAGNRVTNHPAVSLYIVHIGIIGCAMLRNAVSTFALTIHSQFRTIFNHFFHNIGTCRKHHIHNIRRSLQCGFFHSVAGLHRDPTICLNRLCIERSSDNSIDSLCISSFSHFIGYRTNHLNGDLCILCRNFFQFQSGHLIEVESSISCIISIIVERCFLAIDHDFEARLFISTGYILIPVQFN